jgi:hypothetical protein
LKKSYTGKNVIAELVKSGARVGIASNSHKAINNLLLSTAKYCKQKNISGNRFSGSRLVTIGPFSWSLVRPSLKRGRARVKKSTMADLLAVRYPLSQSD